jgi:hypothetical protein
MSYQAADGRRQMLDEIATAVEQIGAAIAALGEAYDEVDERAGDRLEEELFRPVQAAYARAQRTHNEFAQRHGLPTRSFGAATRPAASMGARGHLDAAVEHVVDADQILSELQDSMLPVEVGDPEVRAGLAEVRRALGDVEARAREVVRVLGR